uniref:CENP-V/GFA domain-containing protein n=1 Tax=Panagrolaimus davidi TaxID=227884 RepID=A0A914QUC0_9BILA
MTSDSLKTHKGSCHCGAIEWECIGPSEIEAITCNCSICNKKQNHHFIVSSKNFKLLKGEENLTTYTFNTGNAKHKFCKICGVQSFYIPRSNPDSVAIMPHCIDSNTIEKLTYKTFDGQKWEETMKTQAPKAFES